MTTSYGESKCELRSKLLDYHQKLYFLLLGDFPSSPIESSIFLCVYWTFSKSSIISVSSTIIGSFYGYGQLSIIPLSLVSVSIALSENSIKTSSQPPIYSFWHTVSYVTFN